MPFCLLLLEPALDGGTLFKAVALLPSSELHCSPCFAGRSLCKTLSSSARRAAGASFLLALGALRAQLHLNLDVDLSLPHPFFNFPSCRMFRSTPLARLLAQPSLLARSPTPLARAAAAGPSRPVALAGSARFYAGAGHGLNDPTGYVFGEKVRVQGDMA